MNCSTLGLSAGLCFVILTLVTGCAAFNETKEAPFDVAGVGTMLLRVDNAGAPAESETAALTAEYLAAWGYTVTADAGSAYSHVLVAEIGRPEHGSTPVGFSFVAGNSDPRAQDFQKADVLPLNCALMPKDFTERRAELSMTVDADDWPDRSDTRKESNERKADAIATVCFNLLGSLKVASAAKVRTETSETPAWIPSVRVEIENETPPATAPAADGNVSTPNSPDEKPPVPTAPAAEPRKRIIIRNQGSPVIFKWGHERK